MMEYLVGIIVMQLITGCNASPENNIQRTKYKCILFYAKWCGYCKKYIPIFEEIIRIYGNKLDIFMIEQNDFKNYSEYSHAIINIKGFPTIYLFDANYNIIDNFSGFVSFNKTKLFLEKHIVL